jgi:hypothetical protein
MTRGGSGDCTECRQGADTPRNSIPAFRPIPEPIERNLPIRVLERQDFLQTVFLPSFGNLENAD